MSCPPWNSGNPSTYCSSDDGWLPSRWLSGHTLHSRQAQCFEGVFDDLRSFVKHDRSARFSIASLARYTKRTWYHDNHRNWEWKNPMFAYSHATAASINLDHDLTSEKASDDTSECDNDIISAHNCSLDVPGTGMREVSYTNTCDQWGHT